MLEQLSNHLFTFILFSKKFYLMVYMNEYKQNIPRITLKGWAANSTLRSEGIAFIAMTPKDARYRISQFSENMNDHILICPSLDWSWSDVANEVAGVVADHGTRVSRGSEVSGIVQVAAVLGTRNATSVIKEGDFIEIFCEGNEAIAKVYSAKRA
jgi:phosphohistidine swiveling domain-containing protein